MFHVAIKKKTRLLIIITGLIVFLSAKAETLAGSQQNLWDSLRYSFQLEDQYDRPEVQNQFHWLMHHKGYLNQLGEHSQPYLYYILQEVTQRGMPGEIALLPMIESAYNPFAYSTSGAAGLWQFTTGTGTNFGLKQNWWFDGRRDIYNSTNAALNYLTYLHRFFNGNWMLAIAAYHSGEGTVQNAIKHRQTTNFWSLNLPKDTQSYVPKLLALARLIQLNNQISHPLPYISNTPYFTKINVGTQIDLTNAAHLAGISYPEFLKLNPGNNRWTTSPQGPHTIVLPLDKVDVFVRNLEKIPESQRPHVLAKHAVHFEFDADLENVPESSTTDNTVSVAKNTPSQKPIYASTKNVIPPPHSHKVLHIVQRGDSFYGLTKKYNVNESNIRAWNHFSPQTTLQPGQKLTVWTTNPMTWRTTPKPQTHVIHYTIQSGDSLMGIAEKYHISLKKLMFWNAQLHPKRLMPGKKVVIYL